MDPMKHRMIGEEPKRKHTPMAADCGFVRIVENRDNLSGAVRRRIIHDAGLEFDRPAFRGLKANERRKEIARVVAVAHAHHLDDRPLHFNGACKPRFRAPDRPGGRDERQQTDRDQAELARRLRNTARRSMTTAPVTRTVPRCLQAAPRRDDEGSGSNDL